MLEESETALVEAHDLVMFDLDGVVYVGGEAIDGVAASDRPGARVRPPRGVRDQQRLAHP